MPLLYSVQSSHITSSLLNEAHVVNRKSASFLLFLFNTCAALKKDLVLCVDCNKDDSDVCKIESDSGHYVAPKGILESRSLRSSSLPTTTDLDVCIPTSMKIDGKY